ncbi:hypothetical protein GDO81_020695 [Engystomops pustulosus]|uniref:Uncharacterized protein n=1 Tax=Engystomops pustulosus TaxID=76066 RepID=A0AAV6YUV7_ENGPU|nr:hypothetical protein GDO81_020695 [Engystomops pustulosus]
MHNKYKKVTKDRFQKPITPAVQICLSAFSKRTHYNIIECYNFLALLPDSILCVVLGVGLWFGCISKKQHVTCAADCSALGPQLCAPVQLLPPPLMSSQQAVSSVKEQEGGAV